MRTVDYSDVLAGTAALAGMNYLPGDALSDIGAPEFNLFRTFHDRRLQVAQEIHYWPELCPVEQRYYRAAYDATEDVAAGDERYFIAAQKYYQAIRAQSADTQSPATYTAGEWVENSAYWAECAQSYDVTDWASGTALIVGDQVRNIYDGRFYQCHTAHTTGANFDETKFGELTPFDKYIPYDGTGTRPAAGSGLPAGATTRGQVTLGSGVQDGSITGLGLSYTPTSCQAWIQRPAGSLNLQVYPLSGTITADGFDFELSGITDSTSYTLVYELYNDPLHGMEALADAVDTGSITGLALGFTPAAVSAWVIIPSGGLTLTASVVTVSISADGFDFELSGLTDSDEYFIAWEILAPGSVPGALDGVVPTPIGEVRRVCWKNPRTFALPGEIRFELTEQGIAVHPQAPNVVWVEFRWRRPALKGAFWDSTLTYAVGRQVYFVTEDGVGNFYTCAEAAAAGESPDTDADKWTLVPLPYIFRGYLIQAGYADWLRCNKEFAAAAMAENDATELLELEADKLQRQQKQVRRLDVA